MFVRCSESVWNLRHLGKKNPKSIKFDVESSGKQYLSYSPGSRLSAACRGAYSAVYGAAVCNQNISVAKTKFGLVRAHSSNALSKTCYFQELLNQQHKRSFGLLVVGTINSKVEVDSEARVLRMYYDKFLPKCPCTLIYVWIWRANFRTLKADLNTFGHKYAANFNCRPF